MSYKGRYQPSYPRKYKGNPSNIIYRSLWERKFMVYCDLNEIFLNGAVKRLRYHIALRLIIVYIDIFQTSMLNSKRQLERLKNILLRLNQKDKQNLHQDRKDKQKDIFVKFMNMLAIKQNGKQQVNTVKIVCMNLR